jgi:hypothetical protein
MRKKISLELEISIDLRDKCPGLRFNSTPQMDVRLVPIHVSRYILYKTETHCHSNGIDRNKPVKMRIRLESNAELGATSFGSSICRCQETTIIMR